MAEVAQPTIRVTAPRRLFKDHKDSVLVAAVFPDGRRMVTSSMDRTLCLWDLTEGIVLKKMEGHQNTVRSVTVSRDGQLIASGDQNGELIAWNGDTGESLIQAVKVHSTLIRSLDFSPDGTVLASGSMDKTTELWCTKAWQVQGDPINCGGDSNQKIYCVRFSPSGEFLAISTDGDIQVWNPWTMQCITKFKAAINDAHNYSLAWMPDGTRLFSSGSGLDPTIREWDTSTWTQVGDPWTGHANHVNTIVISSNGALVASASGDHQVRLWRLSDRRTIAIFKDVDEVYCAAFSTDSKKIFSGSRNTINNLKEWAVPDVALIEDTPKEQAQAQYCDVEPTHLATSSLQTPPTFTMVKAVQVIPRFTTPRRVFRGHTGSIQTAAVFPNGHRMVTGSMDKTLLLWDLKDGSVLKKMEGHKSKVRAVAMSQDGQLIASGDEDGVLIAWHGDTGEPLTEAIKIHTTWIHSLDFSPDDTAMASGSWDKTTELWCPKTWQVPGNPINCGSEVTCVRYSPSGEFLAIASSDILIYDSRTRKCIATLKTMTSPWAYSLVWAPDGTRLFSGGSAFDPNIREWDTSTWKQIGDHWSGHTGYIFDIAMNFDGTLIASACKDNQVRLWRLSDRRTIAIFKDTQEIVCVTFSRDGKHIISGGRNMLLKEWAVPVNVLLEDTPRKQAQVSDYKATPPTAISLGPRSTLPTSITMAEAMQVIPRITVPRRAFKDHTDNVLAVALFPDGHRMVTSSRDRTLILWNLKDGVILKKLEGHSGLVRAVAISEDGKLMASGDANGALIAWHGVTGESLTQAITVHSNWIMSLDFSPDGTTLASGSADKTAELWCTKTWQVPGDPIICGDQIHCIRYSPSGEFLAMAACGDISICNPRTRECITILKAWAVSLTWTPDGTRLLSGGTNSNPNIREWDTLTWKQIGDHWSGHTACIYTIAMNAAGTLIASACKDNHVRLWRLSDRRTIAIFKDTHEVVCVTFSGDGKHIISGGRTMMLKEWAVPEDASLEAIDKEQMSEDPLSVDAPEEWVTKNHALSEASEKQVTRKHTLSEDVPEKGPITDHALSEDPPGEQAMYEHTLFVDAPQDEAENNVHSKIIALSMAALNACIIGDLTMAEDTLTQEIGNDTDNHNSYANRSFVMARKSDWDRALHDALKSISIQPSLTGYIAKGIALCGKMNNFQDAMKAFDIAFMFTDGDSKTTHLLLLVKAIALFNANQHEEAMSRVKELVSACPNADILACSVVETYLRVQLGVNAPDHNEAANHFTAAVKSIHFSSQSAIHSKYEVFVVLFGWDLKSLWKTANQNRCHALLRAGRITQALESYQYMMDISDETTRSDCIDWSIGFKKGCGAHYATKGDAAFTAGNYETAIELYSEAIDLDPAQDGIFVNRCNAKLETMQWEEALVDAQKVIEMNPSSYLGYKLKHAALHGTQRYDEAIMIFEVMLSKLDDTPDVEIRKLRRQYVSASEAAAAIQKVIHTRLDNTPHRLLNTFAGSLCDRGAQINAFKTSTEYKELLSSLIKDADIRMEHIERAVGVYFSYAMLSHRWEENESLLQDIQNKVVYHLNSVGGVVKLQAFCKAARDAGYRWAWIDTCCIDQTNNVELQKSVNSMFVWYRHSALTIVYLLDVPPSSKSGALARSVWNTRGWTVQEFLAPEVVLFYQNDWTLYLGDRSLNHKGSFAIMQELADATGIDPQALVAFRPEMKGAREKLQWASARVTTLQEDMAYSLFGIFGIHLPVIYGENKQHALGRLLQEIVARSGDISALDWVGKPSEFNSCLPADIASYKALPHTLSSLSEDQIQTSISSLRKIVAVDSACKLYNLLENLSAPRFANCRLHLPCITFPVTEVIPGQAQNQKITYEVKVNGLMDLLIETEDKLPTRQTLLLVYPWNRDLFELPNPSHDTQSVQDYSVSRSLDTNEWGGAGSLWRASRLINLVRQYDSESHMRELRLIVRLGQPFRGFLLAQHGGEYRRIATDHDIIAQVQEMTSVRKMMDVRTIEIL